MSEADVMLGKIFSGFVFVPFKTDAVIHKFYRFVAGYLIFVYSLNFVIKLAGWLRRSRNPAFYLLGYSRAPLTQPAFCDSAMGGVSLAGILKAVSIHAVPNIGCSENYWQTL